MKKTRYSEAQIMGILRQAESGVAVSELCREHGMSSASFYKWRSKFGGMDAQHSACGCGSPVCRAWPIHCMTCVTTSSR